MILIKNATIYISDICNSRCPTCNIWKNKTATLHSLNSWMNVLETLHEMNISYLGFSGGEPLLCPDIVDLVQKAKEIGFRFVDLCTNGILLDSNMIHRFLEAGLDRMIISMDGLGSLHDQLRGVKGNFETIEKALQQLRGLPIEVLIQTNLLNANITQIPEIIAFAKEHKALWGINLINNTQYYFKNIPKQKLVPDNQKEITGFLSFLAEKIAQVDNNITINKDHLPFLENFLRTHKIPTEINCTLGSQNIYINSDMAVFSGCNALPSVGNCREMSLSKIVASDVYAKRVNQMYQRNCPGCTCGIWSSIDTFLKKEIEN